MMYDIINKKKEFRKNLLILRKKLFFSTKKVFDINLFEKFFNNINIENINIISSFISINTEINTTELNKYILEKDKKLCLPVVVKKDEYLIFREFKKNQNMIDGFMNIKEPVSTSKILIPDLLFIPCLAFDSYGYRLGYGGGYYDKTLSNLKKNKKKFLSVGYAFDGQKIQEVPKENFDMKLDYVITEKKIYSFL